MWFSHLVNFLWTILHVFFSVLGTSVIGFVTVLLDSIASLGVTLYRVLRKQGIEAVRQHWRDTAKIALQTVGWVTLIIYGPILLYSVGRAVYEDHSYLVGKIAETKKDRDTIQRRLDDLTIPRLIGAIDKTSVAPTGEDGMQSLVTIFAHVNNQGTPTVLENWNARAILDDRQSIDGTFIPAPRNGGVAILYLGPRNEHKIYLEVSDHLGIQSLPNPVVRGGGVLGWIQFLFPAEKQKMLNSVLTLYFSDVMGQEHSFTFNFKNGRNFQPPDAEELGRQSKKAGAQNEKRQKH
jgi:hypothetical protein